MGVAQGCTEDHLGSCAPEEEAPRSLPPDVLGIIVVAGGVARLVAVRGVCRAWRRAFDARVAGLTLAAPLAPAGAPGAPPPQPLVFPALSRCCVSGTDAAALRRVARDLASHSPHLVALRVCFSEQRALPGGLLALTGLADLAVCHTALATLPQGLSRLAGLKSLDLSFNALVALPSSIASALHSLAALSLRDNLLTELPPLPRGLAALDISQNRLKRLGGWLPGLTALTSLAAVGAFSHRPRGEGCPTVGALARLGRARGGALALRLDCGVADLVRARIRMLGGGGGAAAAAAEEEEEEEEEAEGEEGEEGEGGGHGGVEGGGGEGQ